MTKRTKKEIDDWKDCARPVDGVTQRPIEPSPFGINTAYWNEAAQQFQSASTTSTVVGADVPDAAMKLWLSSSRASDRIRARIAEKREEYAEYLAHAKIRLREEDLHGLWDCGANASEVSNYIDGLLFALEALGEKP